MERCIFLASKIKDDGLTLLQTAIAFANNQLMSEEEKRNKETGECEA